MATIPEWLTAPEPPLFPWSDLPDPLERYGRHVRFACWAGTPLSHREWVALHGDCPGGCQRLPVVPEASLAPPGGTLAHWRAFYHGCRTYRPINHSPETIASRGGWNALVCQTDTEPMPLVIVERQIGNPYA